MKLPSLLFVALALPACTPPPLLSSGAEVAPQSDLVAPEKRRVAVELAQRLTQPAEPVPLPAKLPQPFSPPNFDQPDPEELRAAAAAAAKAGGPAPAGGTAGGDQPARQAGDREVLESLAAKLQPKGTFVFNGAPLLLIGNNRFEIGAHFIVTDNASGHDYELELVAIASTTFTLRYHSEEITRPIKPGKTK